VSCGLRTQRRLTDHRHMQPPRRRTSMASSFDASSASILKSPFFILTPTDAFDSLNIGSTDVRRSELAGFLCGRSWPISPGRAGDRCVLAVAGSLRADGRAAEGNPRQPSLQRHAGHDAEISGPTPSVQPSSPNGPAGVALLDAASGQLSFRLCMSLACLLHDFVSQRPNLKCSLLNIQCVRPEIGSVR
jgi:hypothetical protein